MYAEEIVNFSSSRERGGEKITNLLRSLHLFRVTRYGGGASISQSSHPEGSIAVGGGAGEKRRNYDNDSFHPYSVKTLGLLCARV